MDDFSFSAVTDRLGSQLRFMLEIDKLKGILRVTRLVGVDRRENAAEHSWHIAVMAMLLGEYANPRVDVCRVMKMLLVHDLIEIDAGDTYCYDQVAVQDQALREVQAADRLFSILPVDQGQEIRSLWEEFEARQTPEARFAVAVDRLMPLLHNFFTQGSTWKENSITAAQVEKRMLPVRESSTELGKLADMLIKAAVDMQILDQ